MDLGAPVGSEAVCDLAEHDRGTDLALRYVVGRRDVAVVEEDEELAPPGLDLLEQDPACGIGGSAWCRLWHSRPPGSYPSDCLVLLSHKNRRLGDSLANRL